MLLLARFSYSGRFSRPPLVSYPKHSLRSRGTLSNSLLPYILPKGFSCRSLEVRRYGIEKA